MHIYCAEYSENSKQMETQWHGDGRGDYGELDRETWYTREYSSLGNVRGETLFSGYGLHHVCMCMCDIHMNVCCGHSSACGTMHTCMFLGVFLDPPFIYPGSTIH